MNAMFARKEGKCDGKISEKKYLTREVVSFAATRIENEIEQEHDAISKIN